MNEEKMCKMIIKDGKHLVTDPDGNILPKQASTFVHQDTDMAHNGWAYVRVTLFVKLDEK